MKIETKDGRVMLNGHYEIELTRIPDERGLCEWVHHLSEKAWITQHDIGAFIAVVFAAKGWTLYKHL